MKTHPNDSIHNSEQGVQDGLTKREHFAAMAMQGLLSAYDSETGIVPNDSNSEYMARVAVKAANYLIAELNKEETE